MLSEQATLEAVEKAARGEALSAAEQGAVTGYELGWRDGFKDASRYDADDWRTVPAEPSVEMLDAARDWSVKRHGIGIGNAEAEGCWRAMYAAAPSLAHDAATAPGTPNPEAKADQNPLPRGEDSSWPTRDADLAWLEEQKYERRYRLGGVFDRAVVDRNARIDRILSLLQSRQPEGIEQP